MAASSPPPLPLPSPSSCLSFSESIVVPSHLPLHRRCYSKRAHASPSYLLLRIAASAGGRKHRHHSGFTSLPPSESSAESQKNCSPPPPPPQDNTRIASGYGAGKDLRCEAVELPDISRALEASAGARPRRADLIDEVEQERIQMSWFQRGFVKVVRPLVRVLNGANLKELSDGNQISARETEQNLTWRSDDDLVVVKEEDLMASWSFVKMLTGSWPPNYHRRKIREGLRQAEVDFFTFSSHVGKFLFTMMATGTVLATAYDLVGGDSELETVIWLSWLAGIIIGSMIGAEKVMQKRFRSGPRNIVITGSTRGLGKALAREFLLAGDRVVITSRSPESVIETVKELQLELESRLYHPFSINNDLLSPKDRKHDPRVIGIACDVSKVDDVKALAEFAGSELGSIDLWINNAGINKGFRPLTQFSDEDIQQIVSANMIGSLLCTREAIRVMQTQRKGGHIFNMDGAGSGGSSTPLTAVYGATKCGLRQLQGSLLQECKRSRVGIHTASPGMVLTDLLLSGASLQNKKMFNIICELPETVARTLVPRMRDIKGTGKAINFLTPPRILLALVTAWLRRGRWFDEEGRAVYAAEADRLRNWAENRARLPVSAAMEQFSDTTLVSVFSITAICAFIMLESGISGT